jgi:hypothetical protein
MSLLIRREATARIWEPCVQHLAAQSPALRDEGRGIFEHSIRDFLEIGLTFSEGLHGFLDEKKQDRHYMC